MPETIETTLTYKIFKTSKAPISRPLLFSLERRADSRLELVIFEGKKNWRGVESRRMAVAMKFMPEPMDDPLPDQVRLYPDDDSLRALTLSLLGMGYGPKEEKTTPDQVALGLPKHLPALTYRQYYATCWFTEAPAEMGPGSRSARLLAFVHPHLARQVPASLLPAPLLGTPGCSAYFKWLKDHWDQLPVDPGPAGAEYATTEAIQAIRKIIDLGVENGDGAAALNKIIDIVDATVATRRWRRTAPGADF